MKFKNSIKSIAIGSFDGIHLAHQKLINEVEAVVIIERNGGYLTAGYKRSWYIKKPCFFYHFEKIQRLDAKAFVEKLEKDFPLLESIVVGYDFGFAYQKEGNVKRLKELFQGEVKVIDEVKLKDTSIHSRTIKVLLREGKVEEVNALLGRTFSIDGQVISGQGLGKKELVPTLNLNVYDYELPKEGVYATQTKIDEVWIPSITFLGHRITTDGNYAVESYILDRDIGIYQGIVFIEFIKFIRDNQKFNGLEDLKKQIRIDIEKAKSILIKK